MDAKTLPVVRKAKKKQVKDELDRNKQAEKKKRRLEKALATSAAIRTELEKKKQMKKEEQQRLDEEGAAIAEAVALRVLLGEDSDEPCQIMLKENDGFNHWSHHPSNVDIFMGGRISGVSHQNIAKAKCSFDGMGWMANTHGSVYDWNSAGNCAWLPVASRPFARNIRGPFFEDGGWGASEISAGISAAQALSSLQIAEDSDLDTIVFNGMLRG